MGGLFPTGSVDVPFTVTNPNPYGVQLTKAELKTVAVDPAHSACATSVITGSDVTLSDSVAANGGTSAPQTFSVTMDTAAPDACQGACSP